MKKVKVKKGLSCIITASMLFSLCVQPGIAQEIEATGDTSKETVKTQNSEAVVDSTFEAAGPEETTTSTTGSTGKWLILGGVAAAGVGLAALALGGGGGGGGDAAPPEPEEPPIGPYLGGSDWTGTLTIRNEGNEGSQAVTAVVTHSGGNVTITTDSKLDYGQYFTGHISYGGYLTVRDSATAKIWTTHLGNATTNSINLYDYVNNTADYDTLFLSR